MFLTTAETAEILRIHSSTVIRMCQAGKLAHEVVGSGKKATYRIYKDRLFERPSDDDADFEFLRKVAKCRS